MTRITILLALLALAASLSAQREQINYDEALVPPYELPDPLRLADGTRVTDADGWRERRRAEVLELFRQHVYGRVPPGGVSVRFELVESGGALEGRAVRKQVRVHCERGGSTVVLHLLLYIPAGSSGPVPAFLGLNFSGNHAIQPDGDIELSRSWMRNRQGRGIVDNRATEASRGLSASRWPVAEILGRGYALATMYYGDIDPDFDDGFVNGVHALFAEAQGLAGATAPPAAVPAAPPPDPAREVYKTVGDDELALHIFTPVGHQPGDRRPAIVFFFGGGWVGGSPTQFYPHCRRLAARGMVAISAEYRVKKRHGTTPFECVADGKSAMRWLRQHAERLGLDPERIVAGGGSAGGHVAAAVATVPGLDDPTDDLAVSPRPTALVLFNPVYDNGPDGYGHERLGDRYLEISPAQNIREGMPPAIVFLGTRDRLIPVATAEAFQAKMRGVGSRSELHLYEGRGHGFFNHGRGDGQDYEDTMRLLEDFLASLGLLPVAAPGFDE